MNPALKTHFTDYAAFHQTKGNQACHYVGIPLIVLSVFALLSAVPMAQARGVGVTLAEVVLLTVTVYYLTLDTTLGLMMLGATALLDAAGHQIAPLPAAGLFVFGWILQFIGHYVYEGRAPAFYRNLKHLLVGPLWILAKATSRA